MALGRDFPITTNEALQQARQILSKNPELVSKGVTATESEQIVMAAFRKVTGQPVDRTRLFAKLGDRLPDGVGEKVLILAGARSEGKPLQYLIGYQVFLNHEYEVGPNVLIPRPETEVLATHAVETLKTLPMPPERGIEIGLGSGALSIELLSRFPALRMIGSELTAGAEAFANKNAIRILGPGPSGVERLDIIRAKESGSVWEPISEAISGGKADFVISNPPYLTESDSIDAEVIRFEPKEALFAPKEDALYFYRKIANEAASYLRSRGFVFLELPHERAELILKLFQEGNWESRLVTDLTNRNRVLIAQLKGK